MATGMFRTTDGSVQVDYDGTNIPIPRAKYKENGYKPDFDKLPLEADYWAARGGKEPRCQGGLKASLIDAREALPVRGPSSE